MTSLVSEWNFILSYVLMALVNILNVYIGICFCATAAAKPSPPAGSDIAAGTPKTDDGADKKASMEPVVGQGVVLTRDVPAADRGPPVIATSVSQTPPTAPENVPLAPKDPNDDTLKNVKSLQVDSKTIKKKKK